MHKAPGVTPLSSVTPAPEGSVPTDTSEAFTLIFLTSHENVGSPNPKTVNDVVLWWPSPT